MTCEHLGVNKDYFNKKNIVVTGRAASGIYLILKNLAMTGTHVLVPVNICYAAVYPVFYAGYHPKFCDVDDMTGNVTKDLVVSAGNDNVSAMIIPHMYGNPVSDIDKIKEYCADNNILLIEDCASAMGAKVKDKTVGSFGDYTVYSTGYSKTIDIGNGGILATNKSIELIEQMNSELPVFKEEMHSTMEFFSKLYRLIRNSEDNPITKMIYSNLADACKEGFLYKLSTDEEHAVLSAISRLDCAINERRRQTELYRKNLDFKSGFITEYSYSQGAVPWRYNVFVNTNMRKKLISQLLSEYIPVSDWYPSIAAMFGDTGEYPNAAKMASRLINFPILIEDGEIIRICQVVNNILREW